MPKTESWLFRASDAIGANHRERPVSRDTALRISCRTMLIASSRVSDFQFWLSFWVGWRGAGKRRCWVADKRGSGHGGRLLLGHARLVRYRVLGAADGSLKASTGGAAADSRVTASLELAALAAQVGVDLTGGVAFEAADDLFLSQAPGGAALHVGAGGGAGAHPDDDDALQGVAGLPVAAAVKAVPGYLA
jgi:hypothetical protein